MVEPAVLLIAAVAAIATTPLVPPVCRGVLRLLSRSARWLLSHHRCSGAIVLVGLTAAFARPTPVVATTPPPVLRIPLPVAPGGGGDPAAVPNDAAGASRRYLVEAGDSLWAISARHLRDVSAHDPTDADVDRAWRRLYAANREVVGADPDLIFPGQSLSIPEEW